MTALQQQHGGDHYVHMKIQPVEFWKANHLNGDEAVIISYVSRWRKKNGLEDLLKARHHLQFIMEDKDYQERVRKISRLLLAGADYRNNCTPQQYCAANEIPQAEAAVIRCITIWNHTGAGMHLAEAMKWMDELVAAALATRVQSFIIQYMKHRGSATGELHESNQVLMNFVSELFNLNEKGDVCG